MKQNGFAVIKGNYRLLLLYLAFSMLFVFMHITSTSIYSFFHFLLDHDMGVIENGLDRNGWEIVLLSKGISFFIFSKFYLLNQYTEKKIRSFYIEKSYQPTFKIFVASCFLLLSFYFLSLEGSDSQPIKHSFVFTSYFGSLLFFLFDFAILKLLFSTRNTSRQDLAHFLFPTFLIFFFASNIVFPYISKYTIFLALHYIAIYYTGLLGRLSDYLVYSLLIIAPLSAFFGIDIVWDNAYSVFAHQNDFPLITISLLWLTALVYYSRLKSRD